MCGFGLGFFLSQAPSPSFLDKPCSFIFSLETHGTFHPLLILPTSPPLCSLSFHSLTVPTYEPETGLVGIKDALVSPILVGLVVLFFLSTSNLWKLLSITLPGTLRLQTFQWYLFDLWMRKNSVSTKVMEEITEGKKINTLDHTKLKTSGCQKPFQTKLKSKWQDWGKSMQ